MQAKNPPFSSAESSVATSPEPQAARAVAMVRPLGFGCNSQTAATNALQVVSQQAASDITAAACREFDGVVAALARAGIDVHVFDPPALPGLATPDAVFPNNWFSMHADGSVVLYPMLAPNRRLERQPALLDALVQKHGYHIERTIDLTLLEAQNEFVEGTGSFVLDRTHRIAYAALSPRTTVPAIQTAAAALGYKLCTFSATHFSGSAIYHTNVMLSVGTRSVIGCFDTLRDPLERQAVLAQIEATHKQTIQLSESQMQDFAANLLELQGSSGPVLAISTRAVRSLDAGQRSRLEREFELCPVDIDTIESVGGGGVRCMIAEVHLPHGSPTSF